MNLAQAVPIAGCRRSSSTKRSSPRPARTSCGIDVTLSRTGEPKANSKNNLTARRRRMLLAAAKKLDAARTQASHVDRDYHAVEISRREAEVKRENPRRAHAGRA